MLKLLLSLGLSAAAVTALALAGLVALAESESDWTPANQRFLQAEANSAKTAIQLDGSELRRAITTLALDPTLGPDLRTLTSAVDVYEPGSRIAKALELRMDQLRGRLRSRVDTMRSTWPQVQGVAFISPEGVVLHSDSPHYVQERDVHHADAPSLVIAALDGSSQFGLRVAGEAISFVAAEPVFVKGALAGLVVFEQPWLHSYGAAASSFIVVDGKAVLGKTPANLQRLPVNLTAVLLAPRTLAAPIPALAWLTSPLFVEPEHVGVMGQRYAIAGTEHAWGVVWADVSEPYRALLQAQVHLVTTAAAVWSALALLLMFAMWPDRRAAASAAKTVAPEAAAPVRGPGPPVVAEEDPHQALAAASEAARVSEEAWAAAPAEDDGYEPLSPELDLGGDMPQDDASKSLSLNSEDALQALESLSSEGGHSTSTERPNLLGDLLEGIPDGSGQESPFKGPTPGYLMSKSRDDSSWTDIQGPDVVTTAAAVAAPRAPTPPTPPTPQRSGPASARDEFMAKLQAKASAKATKAAAPTASVPIQQVVPTPEPEAIVETEAEPLEAEAEPLEAEAELAPADDIQPAEPAPAPAAEAPAWEMPGGSSPFSLPVTGTVSVDTDATAGYRAVYDEFVRLRKSCGETGELSFQKFAGRLDVTRAAVISKHHCEDVVFQAYIKDGKAALKATPR